MYDDIVVGGAGFVGSAVARGRVAAGRRVLVVDQRREDHVRAARLIPEAVSYQQTDLLVDSIPLPEGRVVLAHGISQPRIPHPWQLVQANAWTTARLLRFLHGRDVVLMSSVEVYGAAQGTLNAKTTPVLPSGSAYIRRWCAKAMEMVEVGLPSWQLDGHCRELLRADPSGRWSYALSKRAQELLVLDTWEIPNLRVLRLANVFGPGQERVIERLARRIRAGLPVQVSDVWRTFVHVDDVAQVVVSGRGNGVINAGTGVMRLPELAALVQQTLGVQADVEVTSASGESSGVVDTSDFVRLLGDGDPDRLRRQVANFVETVTSEAPPPLVSSIPVVIPPRPEVPEVVARQTSTALATGVVKGGGPFTLELESALREILALSNDRQLLLTSSGSAALRLAIVAAAGMAEPGDVALLPSFTFAATAEAALQLGYRLQFCDVDADTWTLDPECVEQTLNTSRIKVVIAVDALGNPADYRGLREVCDAASVPLVADSAPSLGSAIDGVPVGSQADVHAFSMSFAKTVSAAGAGGFLTLPREWASRLNGSVDWTRSALLGEVHAAVALDQVRRLDEILARRDAVASIYADLALASSAVKPQTVRGGTKHSWVHWTAAFDVDDRSLFGKHLEASGVLTKPYYAPALHHLEWAARAVPGADLPVTDSLLDRVLALPMSSEMTTSDADAVLWRVLHALEPDPVGPLRSAAPG